MIEARVSLSIVMPRENDRNKRGATMLGTAVCGWFPQLCDYLLVAIQSPPCQERWETARAMEASNPAR